MTPRSSAPDLDVVPLTHLAQKVSPFIIVVNIIIVIIIIIIITKVLIIANIYPCENPGLLNGFAFMLFIIIDNITIIINVATSVS